MFSPYFFLDSYCLAYLDLRNSFVLCLFRLFPFFPFISFLYFFFFFFFIIQHLIFALLFFIFIFSFFFFFFFPSPYPVFPVFFKFIIVAAQDHAKRSYSAPFQFPSFHTPDFCNIQRFSHENITEN